MKRMNRDKQYTLLNNNCQSWVRELLHSLGIKVPVTAFSDTVVGRNLNRVMDAAEDDDSDDSDETVKTHSSRQHHHKNEHGKGTVKKPSRPSSPPGSRPGSQPGSRRGSVTSTASGAATPGRALQSVYNPITWIGIGVGAVATGLAILSRIRRRERRWV